MFNNKVYKIFTIIKKNKIIILKVIITLILKIKIYILVIFN